MTITPVLYEKFRTKSDRKTVGKATENENLGFRTVAFSFAAPKSRGTKAKPAENRAFRKPALCENFRIGSLLRPQNKSSTFALKKTSDEGCTPEKYTKNEKLNQISFFCGLFV